MNAAHESRTSSAKNMLKIIVGLLEWVIFFLMAGVFLVLISPVLPTKKFIATYVVASGSMLPSLTVGSIVFIQPVQLIDLKEGDIITFASPTDAKNIVIHRIHTVLKTGSSLSFKTKGDNNTAPDVWTVNGMHIKGRYIASVPYVGYITVLIKDPKMFALIIGIPTIILIVLQVKKIREGIEEEVQRRLAKQK